MSNISLWIGSRKGLFNVTREHGWKVSQPHFLGDPVSIVLPDPRDGSVYAALQLGHFGPKIWRMEKSSADWLPCESPVYPASAGDVSTFQVWSFATADPGQPGTLWAGTIPGGLFYSGDAGASWTLNEPLWNRPERAEWFGGGYDDPGIHSICVDPVDPSRVAVGISCGGIWRSVDAGRTWTLGSSGMRAAYMPPEKAFDPNIQDPHLLVQCREEPNTFWTQHHNGVFRSNNGLDSWQEISRPAVSPFGFAVAVHPSNPDTAWFAPAVKDETRVPVDARVVVTRTRDGGESFEVLSKGLPSPPAYDLIFRHCLAVDSSGEVLALGSTTGGLWLSEDQGDSWLCISTHLPPVYCLAFENRH